ncbi:lanthionine synthetase C family protein [Nocardioides speluncae]|uniref:lanthionine synthetase C family protein n=1 Tax=Nocardioides speluncae TaxID=2670337 RepID=UPI000D6907E6|nr:lanthionine synthetase C family protein [Nocardioides speluncae]
MPHPAARLAEVIADQLAHPDTVPGNASRAPGWRQSLAHGIPGIALLHVELAATGRRPWQRAHDWITASARGGLTSGADSHPFYGAPAFAHAAASAADQLPDSYQRAHDKVAASVAGDVRTRLSAAHRRIDRGRLVTLAEFDALRGLTGYGTHLLRRHPDSEELRAVLEYLVRLTAPITDGSEVLPGWWTPTGPSGRPDDRFRGGHANNGIAHGITGVLSLLSSATLRAQVVDGQVDAMKTICAWLDRWRAGTASDPAWPYLLTRSELRRGRRRTSPPLRPSWCYGTAGTGRAQQLAGLALGDTRRQHAAETAVIEALTDPAQLAAVTDRSLCHGYAGLAYVATRMADDAGPATAHRLRQLLPTLLDAVAPPDSDHQTITATLIADPQAGPGLLDGAAGIALCVLAASRGANPRSGWDTCLLV